MKRVLLILMLLILPLQFSWAAAAVYCQHEEDASVRHIGHHVHKHQSASGSDKKQDSSKVHQDCDYCHLACQASLVGAVAALPAKQETPPYTQRSIFFSSHIPDGPMRPDRSSVA